MRPKPNLKIMTTKKVAMTLKLGWLIFRPMPVLSVLTLICFAILISLGNWQYRRLHWKTALLKDIDQAAHAEPLQSLAQIDAAYKVGEPLDFRRVALQGRFIAPDVNGGAPYHLMRSDGKRYYWRLYQPYQDGDDIILVATQDFDKDAKASPPNALTGAQAVIGYVRKVQPANRFTPKSTPEQNRWFAFNAAPEKLDWSQSVTGYKIPTTYFIDQVIGAPAAEDLAVRMPDVPNNHLDYMLTWYSFVIILLVIYLLLHKKAGRLGIVGREPQDEKKE